MYVCYLENNVPCRLSPQCLFGNSCTWAHDVHEISLVSYSYLLSQEVILSSLSLLGTKVQAAHTSYE